MAAEPETVDCKLPLVILVWRDDGYGVIHRKQMLRFGRTSSVKLGPPDFTAYARDFGAAGVRVERPSELTPILREALEGNSPAVLDCPVDYGENLRMIAHREQLR